MTFDSTFLQSSNDGNVSRELPARPMHEMERKAGCAVTVDRIWAAVNAIAPYVKLTPALRDQALSERFGTNVYLKYEVLQHTGAFKIRGAFNKMLSLTADECGRGVVAVSGGNHAQAVAYAGRALNIGVTALMPEFTPDNYVRRTMAFGAKVEKFPALADAFAAAEKYEAAGLTLIHPFDDPYVVSGQGTIGLEILQQVPEVTDVIVSIGGGGLAAGISTLVRSLKPSVELWGVETKGADSMSQAIAAERPVDIGKMTSIARTLGATTVGKLPFDIVRRNISEVVVVSDDEALSEIGWLLENSKVLTEPAASCTIAAAERLKTNFGSDDHVVIVLCGGNQDVRALSANTNLR